MSRKRVRVELGDRGYDVVVGESLLLQTSELLGDQTFGRASVITDSNVEYLYAEPVETSLRNAGVDVSRLTVEPGEVSKSMDRASELVQRLAGSTMTRADLVVALGGGVVGDLAGFVASVFKRGCPLLQVPTTLMAQVDSSIGGKTGINLSHGKNLVGTFYQPKAVICDVGTLQTLQEREYLSGLAEVAKYSLISPRDWPGPLLESAESLHGRRPEVLTEVVSRCATIKARVVSADEQDRGTRSVLNYGHTLGHALEAATGYSGEYTHGEAVSIGMVFAALVSVELGLAERSLVERHRALLGALGLPTSPVGDRPDFDLLVEALAQDKKSEGGLTMVLLEDEGAWQLRKDLDARLLRDCYLRLVGD